jgi:hypothetical protein
VHVDVGTANAANSVHNLFRLRIPVLAGKAPFTIHGEMRSGEQKRNAGPRSTPIAAAIFAQGRLSAAVAVATSAQEDCAGGLRVRSFERGFAAWIIFKKLAACFGTSHSCPDTERRLCGPDLRVRAMHRARIGLC